MLRGPPRSNGTDPLFPDTTPFRSVVELAEPVLARGEPGLAAAIGDHASRSPVAVALAGIEDAANLDAALGDGDQRVVDAGRLGEGEDREVDKLLRLRSEEHTSELQSLMRISYAVFCLKKKKK